MADDSKTALIIGASRGLGLALTKEFLKRGWQVVATIRSGSKTDLHAVAEKASGRLEIETVDVADAPQIGALKTRLQNRTFDLVFVNAGVTNDPQATIGSVSTDEFNRIMVTNTLGPMRVIEQFYNQVPITGLIGAMTSGLGSISQNTDGGWELYRASKAALNTLMRSFAARQPQRALLLMHPGWVQTDMGGAEANLTVDDSIPKVADVLLAHLGKPGLQYLDYQGKTVPW